jgi:hypothetical protein
VRFNLDFFEAEELKAETKTWKETIIDRIKDGRVVPIISSAFMNDAAFGSHQELVRGWAKYIHYPLINENHDLAKIAQYESVSQMGGSQVRDEDLVREKYLEFLSRALTSMARRDPNVSADTRAEVEEQAPELTVSGLARRLNCPSLNSSQDNPLLLLADLPLPIYLTTGYHDFIELALRTAGKEPHTEMYRWHEGLRHIPSIFEREREYEPTPQQPLVYYLHGFDRYPESLVLTEDDYLDFLSNVSGAILPRVMEALTQSSLIMLGYSLAAWDFRVLFRGLIKPRPKKLTSVAIQLEENALEKEYLQKYLRQVSFEVEWIDAGDPHRFIRELHQGWAG